MELEGLDCPVYTDEKWAVFILGQLLQNAARYRARSLPVTGALLKEEDRGEEQMTLL